MTIQNWALRPDAAIIVCDTIATHMDTNRPMQFMSKAFVVPHLSLMIAVRGWAYPAQSLFSNLALGHGPENVADLPVYASRVMRDVTAQFSEPQQWHSRTDVVVFGWDESLNKLIGWMFDGDEHFKAECMPANGELLLQPHPRASVGGLDWYGVGIQQQIEDREISDFDRDNVGGMVLAYEMTINSDGKPPKITITNYGKLPHFDEQAAAITDMRRDTGTPAFQFCVA